MTDRPAPSEAWGQATPRPRVSVAMAAYNVAAYLREALDSVFAQSYRNFEILVVDDGSTDGSAEILASYEDPRLRVFHQQNQGVAKTRNRMLQEARGDYFAIFDADDVMCPRRLERQVDYLDAHPDCVIVGGQVIEMNEDGELLSEVRRYATVPDAIAQQVSRQFGAVIPHPGCMYRLDVARALRGYDPAIRSIGEDMEFIERMLTRGAGANLPETVIRYRLRRSSACTLYRKGAAEIRQLMRQRTGHAELSRNESSPTKSQSEPEPNQRRAEATYLCRVGRAALRGARYKRARRYYAQSIAAWPFQWLAYTGLLRAFLRVGSAPHNLSVPAG